jgi:threonine dehydrogenase-like Zn-dependent dehydrogenase
MNGRQVVILEPCKVAVREVELPPPAANQVLVRTEVSAVSAGTELAVWTGTHQWLKDPGLPDWKFPFRPGYSAAGVVAAVGSDVRQWKPGDRVSYPGNHASAELLTLGRSAAVLGLGVIGQFALRCLIAAGAWPVVGIDAVAMRREAAKAAGADHVLDPSAGDVREQLARVLGRRGAEVVADATGVPDAVPVAMSLACDGGQVVVVGSPRGKAKEVNFYDDLHRRYIEVTGAHGNMLFEPAHVRLAGAWDIDKAQSWLLAALASGRLNLEKLVTHRIAPEGLGEAYEGLLKKKEEYLGVVVRWQ